MQTHICQLGNKQTWDLMQPRMDLLMRLHAGAVQTVKRPDTAALQQCAAWCGHRSSGALSHVANGVLHRQCILHSVNAALLLLHC